MSSNSSSSWRSSILLHAPCHSSNHLPCLNEDDLERSYKQRGGDWTPHGNANVQVVASWWSVSRGLFDVHKLLFSFQICVKILEAAGKLDMDEYNFFIRGGLVRDRQRQTDNPCSSWLPDSSWDNITHLATLQPFRDITKSFERRPEQWKKWFSSTEPENAALPDFGEGSCTELQRMLILRSLRPDRVSLCISSFVVNTLGRCFVESPLLDLTAVVKESTCRTPLIFVLAPGVDPTGDLLQLAEASGMSTQFHALSLGRDQAHIARSMIEEGVQNGASI
ncbi:uncharacterized protein V6R79_016251 [Siganus canaliculatus]